MPMESHYNNYMDEGDIESTKPIMTLQLSTCHIMQNDNMDLEPRSSFVVCLFTLNMLYTNLSMR